MAQVDVEVNGHVYKVACENGQEPRLAELARHFDRQVARLAGELGQIGEARLLLLAALTVCDELYETRRRLADEERASASLDPATAGGAARVIAEATERVAAMTQKAARG
jgi:cell division protein ZapA